MSTQNKFHIQGNTKLWIVSGLFVIAFLILGLGFTKTSMFSSLMGKSSILPAAADQSAPMRETVEKQLVANYPDFPDYPGSKLVKSFSETVNGNVQYEAQWDVPDNLGAVRRYYVNKLTEAGWQYSDSGDPEEVSETSLNFSNQSWNLTINLDAEQNGVEMITRFAKKV